MAEDKRRQVKDQISAAAEAFLKELDVDLPVRKIIEVAFLDGRVNKLLSL